MIIGEYEFKNQNLIDMALTHSSFSAKNYERLEFLGDSILDFLVADILFENKKLKEDELTRARANLVSETALCKVFEKLELENKIKVGKSCRAITNAIKGDIVESIVATIYLESGLDACKKFILTNFDLSIKQEKDYKTSFQEYAQKYKYNFKYVLDKTEGPAHDLRFYISLYVNEEHIASACAKSKSLAEKECAKIALEKFKAL